MINNLMRSSAVILEYVIIGGTIGMGYLFGNWLMLILDITK